MPDAPDITGPLRDWLATRREELNGKFRLARRRFPQLDAEAVLALTGELLPSLPPNPDLLASAYDLILLHAGRGTLSPDGGSNPAIGLLLRTVLPRLERLLLTSPRSLPGALSNAVENLGPRGSDFATALPGIAEHLQDAKQLLDAGIVVAWRLGDARCREKALEFAARLPPRAVLVALRLESWPEADAASAIAALAADAWRIPGTPAADDSIPVGDFAGFGGPFLEPPMLLDPGTAHRHRFWAKSGNSVYRIDADVFGWTARPDPSVEYPVAESKPRSKDRSKRGPAGSTSVVHGDGVTAYTLPDSFRIRVQTSARAAP